MSKANFFDVLYDIEYNIGIYGCRSMTFPMSHAICKPAFPPPAAGRTSNVPAGNLNMTRNLKSDGQLCIAGGHAKTLAHKQQPIIAIALHSAPFRKNYN